MAEYPRQTRRAFLRGAGGVAAAVTAAPYFAPARALGADGAAPPSDRIVMGVIGTGGMGKVNLDAFMNQPDVQMVAVCDVDAGHRDEAVAMVKAKSNSADCRALADFRDLLALDGLDAVVVATPDHWHALATIAAVRAGKDVYCEKPLANSIAEGRAIVTAAREHDRVVQVGSGERSNPLVRQACELVRNGRLGKINLVRAHMPTDEPHHQQARALKAVPPAAPIPAGFDYDFWLGHTAEAPYCAERCHFWWRFNLAYGGGEMTDRGAHILDIAQLALDRDESGPTEFKAHGVASTTSLYNAYFDFAFENIYPDGVRLVGTSKNGPRGIGFEGDRGKLFVHIHGGKLDAEPASLLDEKIGPDEIQLGRTADHRRNFLDAIRSRRQPFASAETGHRTASMCHINNIAMRLGRPLTWDPASERFVNDDEANALLAPTMRSPWTL